MTEARIEEIVADIEFARENHPNRSIVLDIRAAERLIADWRAKKAEIERLTQSPQWHPMRPETTAETAEAMRAKCEGIARDYAARHSYNVTRESSGDEIADAIAVLKEPEQ